MTNRVKQMLNLVSEDYGGRMSASQPRREVHKARRLNDLCDTGFEKGEFAYDSRIAYQSPRQPDAWHKPRNDYEALIEAREAETGLDPVGAAMTAFEAARSGKKSRRSKKQSRRAEKLMETSLSSSFPRRGSFSDEGSASASIKEGTLVSTKRKGSWLKALRRSK